MIHVSDVILNEQNAVPKKMQNKNNGSVEDVWRTQVYK